MPILERDHILHMLGDRLDAAREGHGSFVFLNGEAGAGKTTVVQKFVSTTDADTLVFEGHCDPLSTPRPLGPLSEISEQQDFGVSMGDHENVYSLFADVIDRLTHTVRPILIVVEDVHWADQATLDMLIYIGRRISATKALVLATYRGDQIGSADPLRRVIGDLMSRPSVTRLDIELLSLDAVRSMVGGSSIDADTLFRLTGGNPFYVTEVLASEDYLPATVEEAVLARIGMLAPAVRRAVEAVSVAPRSMSPEEIEALVPGGSADAEVALQAGVLVADSQSYRFRHELARVAVRNSIPGPRRSTYHRTMVEIASASSDLAKTAHHSIESGDRDLILTHAPVAAREAASRGAHREAVEFFAAVHPNLHRLDLSDRIAILDEYRASLDRVDDQLTHLQVANELLTIAESTTEPALIGRAHRLRAHAAFANGDAALSQADCERSLELLKPLGDSVHLVDTLRVMAHNAMLNRRYEIGQDFAARSTEMAIRLGDDRRLAECEQTAGTLELVMGDFDEGVRLILKSIESDGSGTPRHPNVPLAYLMLGSGSGEVRRYDEASRWLEQGIALSDQLDDDFGLTYDTAWEARIHLERGQWDEAARLADWVVNKSTGGAARSRMTGLGVLGRLRVRRGDPDATGPLRAAIDEGSSGALQHVWPSYCALAEWHILRGENDVARGVLSVPLERVLDTDTLWGRGEIAYWMWVAGGLDATPDRLAQPYASMIAGEWESAAAAWNAIGAPYEHALALWQGSTEAKLSAIRILNDLGAVPAGAWMRRTLRTEGVTEIPRGPRQETKADEYGLTPRQAEVFSLIAQGLSNSEIATRLYISQKTVEHHVSAIFRQLGVANRAQAVAKAAGFKD